MHLQRGLSTAVVGVLMAAFAGPVTADELLVSGWFSHNVVKYDGQTGEVIEPLVPSGGGGLTGAHAAKIGPDGLLYVASFGNDRILRYDPSDGTSLGTFVPAGSGGLNGPSDLIFDPDGNLCVTSFFSNAVLRYDGTSGAFIGFAATGISNPEALSMDGPDGDLYVVSGVGARVVRYDADSGAFLGNFVAPGSGGLVDPHDFLFAPDGYLYLSAMDSARVNKYDGQTGAFIENFVIDDPTTPAIDETGGLVSPHGLEIGPDGHLYVASFGSDEVLRYDGRTGDFIDAFVTVGAGGINGPISLEFVTADCPPDLDGDGSINAADLAQLLGSWGPCGDDCPADFDGNGAVGAADLAVLLGSWGPCG